MIRVFIVEDHAIMRHSLRKLLLREADFSIVDESTSAEDALEKLQSTSSRPDVILVDVSLPGMSGLDLISEIQARWPELFCIVLSGYDGSVYERKALAAGARAYISKEAVLDIVPSIRRALVDGAMT